MSLPLSTLAPAPSLAASAAASSAAEAASPRTAAAEAAFARLTDEDWQWRLAQFPLMATSVGAPGHDHELDRVDAATRAAQRAWWQQVHQRLAALDPAALSPASRVNLAVFRHQIDTFVRQADTHEDLLPINSDSAFYDGLIDLPDGQPLADLPGYEAYLQRLSAIPRYFAEHEALMREGLRTGYTVPQVVLAGRDQPLADVAALTKAEDSPFWKPFAHFPAGVPQAAQAGLQARAREVIAQQVLPAYGGFLAFLRQTYVPGARQTTGARDLPDGQAYYQARILDFTTLPLTAAQIHAQGLAEVARIEAEMQAVMRQTGFTGDFQAFLQQLRSDPQFQARTSDELLGRAALLSKRIDGLLPKYFGLLPRQPYGVAPVPAAIAPFYTGGRYVPAPQPVGASGTYWVNTHDLPSRPLYLLPALTLHEAVPGHHLQIALAAEAGDLPPWRRFGGIDAYVEGWALYAEHLGLEMGIYQTPYEQFGRLSYEMWRACRLVVDTGLHTQGWTREQARDYLLAHTAMSRHEAGTEVDRYVSWPGQALAYKLGEMSIRRLRREAEQALGPRFDLRAFHDLVLAQGAVPLPVLEQQVQGWVEQRR